VLLQSRYGVVRLTIKVSAASAVQTVTNNIARQQLGKHHPLALHDDNGESIVIANVAVRSLTIA
jgi:hypothetical protein